MKKGLILGLTLAATFVFAAAPAFAQENRDATPDVQEVGAGPGADVIAFEETPSHIFLTRDEYERSLFREPLARRSANMTYHGGKIMPTAVTKNIFWGTSWAGYSGDKMTGLDTWYSGYNNSNYARTSTEYTGSNGRVGALTTHQGHVVDTTAASGGGSTSAILAEVCKVITAPDTSGNGYYAVYTDLPRGSAGYCAWHSAGSCGGVPVQFAFFWNLDGDPGCDPQDTSGLHSQGLSALANVTGHELAEAMTDPANPGAWYDSQGQENGDKCAWTWGAPLLTFSNGSQWKVQGEWSNAAYTAGTGYPNRSGQRGCLGGL
ncbi:MAG TPA: hypothetical protein VGM13_08195 [Thermoanaerobaculia bacterium]|jgi:hypothetical protein